MAKDNKSEPKMPTFMIGQSVRLKNDTSEEVREVVSFRYDPVSQGFLYTLTSTEIDVAQKKLIEGVVHVSEDEIISVTEQEEE